MDNYIEGSQQKRRKMAIMQEDEDGIIVPNWLIDVLTWITRIEMANSSMSFSCKLFKQICWPKLHENVKPKKIKQLQFRADLRTYSGLLLVEPYGERMMQIPNMLPPAYILGFKYIYINFLDAHLLEFVQNILPRLNQIKFSVGMKFHSWTLGEDKRVIAFRRLLDLLANKIVKFSFHNYCVRVFEFNLLFPGFIQKVHHLCACPIPLEFGVLFDWLAFTPINGEEHQKIIELEQSNENDMDKFIGRIKEDFSNATKCVNFFIICPFASRIENFNMKNEKTGEILTLYQSERIMQISNYNLIVRCPKGEEEYWNKEGQRKMRESWEFVGENETYIQANHLTLGHECVNLCDG